MTMMFKQKLAHEFLAALISTAKSQKQLKCPSRGEWMDKNGLIHKLYFSAI